MKSLVNHFPIYLDEILINNNLKQSKMKNLFEILKPKTAELFKNNGAFFAYSNKQFNEQKKEGIEYVNILGGLIGPKDKAKFILSEMERLYDESVIEHVKNETPEKIISYEYFNHETQLTGDINTIIDLFSEYTRLFPIEFSYENILKECDKCYKLAIKNDWF
jgi:hydroxymethylpyrimidine pyrophosphatase-like HAD family hydrolase